VAATDRGSPHGQKRGRILIASSNEGKLREYHELAGGSGLELELLPNFHTFPSFEESALTFAENSAGKALHYSSYTSEMVLAEDSGLVVPALGGSLGGTPGVHSARYAGPGATDEDRNRKLLNAMRGKARQDRLARFICVTTIARQGQAMAILSDFVEGLITEEPRGTDGFGYDPLFLLQNLNLTFAQIPRKQKNLYSHRGRTFRKVMEFFSLSAK